MIIGLTGTFGTGKTFVASIFKGLGAKIIDADVMARKTYRIGRIAYKEILRSFGSGILDTDNDIDRKKLASVVFSNRKKLDRLNRIVHPQVIKEIKNEIKRLKKKEVLIIDAPLLVEANVTGLVDKLIVVKASKANQIKRCRKKFHINKEDILKRIKRQIPLERKIKLADFVIDNSGTKSDTRKQVVEIWRKIVWK